MPRLGRGRSEDRSSMNMRERLEVAATRYILERIDYLAASSPLEQLRSLQSDAEFRQQLHSWLELEVFQNWEQEIELTEIRNFSDTASQRSAPLQLSQEITHPAPMSARQIKQSVEARPETNQDVRFLGTKQRFAFPAGRKPPRFHCGHVYCRPCKDRLGRSQGVFDVQEVFGWSDPTFQKAPFAFGSEIE